MPVITSDKASTNVRAFLDMIAFSEIGKAMLGSSDNGYNVLVGSTPTKMLVFDSYARHPNVYNQKLHSTAAGRYQILHKYWIVYQVQLKLPDFSPLSQDLYAIQQLRERKALLLIENGRIESAIARVNNIWASLPGAGYHQHENELASLLAAYEAARVVCSAT